MHVTMTPYQAPQRIQSQILCENMKVLRNGVYLPVSISDNGMIRFEKFYGEISLLCGDKKWHDRLKMRPGFVFSFFLFFFLVFWYRGSSKKKM
jgi:hypothetical protein